MSDVPAVSATPERRTRERRRYRFWTTDFTVEDLILYIFGAVILTMFWLMFGQIQSRENALAAVTTANAMKDWHPGTTDDLRLAHMKAQLALSALRYEQAVRTSASISTRRNFGFLIGAIIALLGSVIAIRSTRGGEITAGLEAGEYAKMKITTTSAGAFLALLGVVVVLATVLNNDRANVDDDGIILAPLEASTATTTTMTTSDATQPGASANTLAAAKAAGGH